jgi:hypothetical protein
MSATHQLGDESPHPVIPIAHAGEELLPLSFTQEQIPRRSPGDLLGMTGLGCTHQIETLDLSATFKIMGLGGITRRFLAPQRLFRQAACNLVSTTGEPEI